MAIAKPKTETTKGKNVEAKPSKLANILAAAKKVLKTDSWMVNIDPSRMTQSIPHIPSGSIVVDYLIGGAPNDNGVAPCPGYPRSRITQLWGQEGAGKTTMALAASAAVTAAGGSVFYLDWENAIVIDYAARLGVPITDPDRFMLVQPSTLEEGLKLLRMAALAGADLIVIDSVGAAVPENIAERDVGETGEQARVGLAAQRWAEFLPQFRGDILRSGSAVLGIAQTRSKIGGMGNGPQYEPQGGQAWKFYTDLRIEIRRIQQEKAKGLNYLSNKIEERVVGSMVNCKIVKCKLSDSQGREEKFYIRQGSGIDDVRTIVEIATSYNVIRKSGGWFYYGDSGKWQGQEQVLRYFKGNDAMFAELVAKVRPFLTKESSEPPEADVEDDALDEFVKNLDTPSED